jgi:hypothetical protein
MVDRERVRYLLEEEFGFAETNPPLIELIL